MPVVHIAYQTGLSRWADTRVTRNMAATEGEHVRPVLVARNGKILFEKGYGLANIGDRVPVTPLTKFRIGSMTKQFTAAAILKLHEQGKLNLDDKLSKFIPDYPRGDEVTIHHLLTHT